MIRVADVMSLDGAVVRLVVDLAEILSYKIGRSIAHNKQVIGKKTLGHLNMSNQVWTIV